MLHTINHNKKIFSKAEQCTKMLSTGVRKSNESMIINLTKSFQVLVGSIKINQLKPEYANEYKRNKNDTQIRHFEIT